MSQSLLFHQNVFHLRRVLGALWNVTGTSELIENICTGHVSQDDLGKTIKWHVTVLKIRFAFLVNILVLLL